MGLNINVWPSFDQDLKIDLASNVNQMKGLEPRIDYKTRCGISLVLFARRDRQGILLSDVPDQLYYDHNRKLLYELSRAGIQIIDVA